MRAPLPICAVEMEEKKHGEYDIFLPPAALYLVLGKGCAVTELYDPTKLEAKINAVTAEISNREKRGRDWLARYKAKRSNGDDLQMR